MGKLLTQNAGFSVKGQELISDPQTQDFDCLKVTNVSGSKKERSPNYEVHNIFQIREAQTGPALKGILVV